MRRSRASCASIIVTNGSGAGRLQGTIDHRAYVRGSPTATRPTATPIRDSGLRLALGATGCATAGRRWSALTFAAMYLILSYEMRLARAGTRPEAEHACYHDA